MLTPTRLRRRSLHRRGRAGKHAVPGKTQHTAGRRWKHMGSVRGPSPPGERARPRGEADGAPAGPLVAAPLHTKRAHPQSPHITERRGYTLEHPDLPRRRPPAGAQAPLPTPTGLKECTRPSPTHLAICASKKLCPQHARRRVRPGVTGKSDDGAHASLSRVREKHTRTVFAAPGTRWTTAEPAREFTERRGTGGEGRTGEISIFLVFFSHVFE